MAWEGSAKSICYSESAWSKSIQLSNLLNCVVIFLILIDFGKYPYFRNFRTSITKSFSVIQQFLFIEYNSAFP